ncbi:Aminomethyltransferase folate-binding domain-containing protein [Dentipellis sp. KUC8613]|nr:Aminomethyltransferase folate-binding domain-containing protein [Dentipellis sp. KUC8613]
MHLLQRVCVPVHSRNYAEWKDILALARCILPSDIPELSHGLRAAQHPELGRSRRRGDRLEYHAVLLAVLACHFPVWLLYEGHLDPRFAPRDSVWSAFGVVGGEAGGGVEIQDDIRAVTIQWLTPSSLAALPSYTSTLSVLLIVRGGIIDDTIITKHDEDMFYVNSSVNAAAGKVEREVLENWGLLALRGLGAASYLQGLTSYDLSALMFDKSAFVPIEGFNLHVARGGYTGEDGFERSCSPSPLQLTGLGARESLRLEAGMCLYGEDLYEDTTPAEGALSRGRRDGLVVKGAPARHGAKILAPSASDVIGHVTSGIPSTTLGKNIAMDYILNGWHKKGTEVAVEVRGKHRPAVLTPMPFVKVGYWRG